MKMINSTILSHFKDGVIKRHTKTQKIVYHYTSPSGILSILQNDKLWFTDCQYLNDKSEYIYIKKPLIKAYKLIGEEPNEPFLDKLLFTDPYQSTSIELTGEKRNRIRFKNNRFFLFCTSNNADSQNMWNYYVKNGQYLGYNLGIKVDALVKHLPSAPGMTVTHGKVLYDENKQVYLIKTFLEKLNAQTEPLQKRYDEAKKQGNDDHELYILEDELAEFYQEKLKNYIDEIRLFFKHKAFESENEYRFVVKVPDDFENNDFELKYRIGINGVIIPYRELSINGRKQVFSQITLSPMMEIELANSGLQSLLKKLNKDIKIINSNIHIRF
ncbi:DUF2971 domain-containing protein [Candidatus Clostridium radicumherbarum]|uniref:DUF2971 domain-containing protein n=1 Tax=Candidatus Clostridium radicumherbarum TaxID=3381662 RepID=A0ABW8TSI2_9CLOT